MNYTIKPMRHLSEGKQLYKVVKLLPMSDIQARRKRVNGIIVAENLSQSEALKVKRELIIKEV